MNHSKIPAEFNTQRAWERLRSRLEAEALIPDSPTQKDPGTRWHYLKWAASFLLLLALGSMFWLSPLLRRQSEPELLAESGMEDYCLSQLISDGSLMVLSQNTRISGPEVFSDDERRLNIRGEAYFHVAPQASRPFRLEAGPALIEVLGTSFCIRSHNKNDFELWVESGSVSVIPHESQGEIRAEAGMRIRYQGGEWIRDIQHAEARHAWWRERMHFRDEPLPFVLRALELTYGTAVRYEDQSLAERRLSLTLAGSELTEILHNMALALNLELYRQGEAYAFRLPADVQ